MALRKVGITSAERSPVGSLEALGKNRSASNFSVISQKGEALTLGLLERSKHDIPAVTMNTATKAWMVDIQATVKT